MLGFDVSSHCGFISHENLWTLFHTIIRVFKRWISGLGLGNTTRWFRVCEVGIKTRYELLDSGRSPEKLHLLNHFKHTVKLQKNIFLLCRQVEKLWHFVFVKQIFVLNSLWTEPQWTVWELSCDTGVQFLHERIQGLVQRRIIIYYII